ncbi:MAG TPA: hypothetical protein EYP85_11900 [Armatimonadetes bacterium]|nr:hypothetical protein [Armatimonadota bacterium]
MGRFRWLVGLGTAFLLTAIEAGTPAEREKGGCLVCHGRLDFVEIRADGTVRSLYVNPAEYVTSVHRRLACEECHPDRGFHARMPPSELSSSSAEGTAKNDVRSIAIASCARCHAAEAGQYRESVHGTAQAQGQREAADCVHCHGSHAIRKVEDPGSSVNRARVPTTCARCHAEAQLMEQYGLNPYTYETYVRSFHGKKQALGSPRTATCVSCHGVHNIQAPEDPRSTAYPLNRMRTCGQCHPGATENFARSFDHIPPSRTTKPLVHYTDRFFLWLTWGTMSLLIGHILLDLSRHWRQGTLRFRWRLAIPKGRTFLRFDLHQRLQHLLMLLSFFLTVLTGFPLKFPRAFWASPLARLWGGIDQTGIVHRFAAVMMMVACGYHLAYLAWKGLVKKHWQTAMQPRWKDVQDVGHNLLFFLGLKRTPPRFDRFTYYEKFDYWAVFWGIFIMAGSGVLLWFPVVWTRWLSPILLEAAQVAHSDEALLAVLAVFIWHFYNVHFNPRNFPLNLVWLTGKISEEELRERHPLEYERLWATPEEELPAASPAKGEPKDETKERDFTADIESPPAVVELCSEGETEGAPSRGEPKGGDETSRSASADGDSASP